MAKKLNNWYYSDRGVLPDHLYFNRAINNTLRGVIPTLLFYDVLPLQVSDSYLEDSTDLIRKSWKCSQKNLLCLLYVK